MKKVEVLGIYCGLILVAILLVSSCSSTRLPKTIMWNRNNLKALQTDNKFNENEVIQKIIKSSDIIVKDYPIAVTNKFNSFAPNMHYYCSVGPYWWKDSISGQYIHKDGLVNPDYYHYDATRLDNLKSRLRDLSIAYYLTGENSYYKAFETQLQTWFCDSLTYMYPNFEYAQVVPGENNNKGRCYGIIEAYTFNSIIESIRLVDSKKPINKKLLRSIKDWFKSFVLWMDYGVFAEELRKANNNIGVAYDVILINMYLFVGEDQRANEICNSFADKRILIQINEKGEQPKELERTKAFSYSVLNLSYILDFLELSKQCRLTNSDVLQERTEVAFKYLSQFLGHKEKFPYSEISNWETCERGYQQQYNRFLNQKGKKEANCNIRKATDLNSILY